MELFRACLLAAAVLAAGGPLSARASGGEITIVPKPLRVERKEGTFRLEGGVKIFPDGACGDSAAYLREKVEKYTGLRLGVVPAAPARGAVVRLVTEGGDPELGPEGYVLVVEPGGVTIRAPKPAGVFYGVQSLLQLIPAEAPWDLPCTAIRDKPRFAWRGLHLDVSRHFFGPAFIKKYIDLLALHKMNVFHWHLVDGQGWRIEIKKYPRLTEVGAWRSGEDGKTWNYRRYRFPLDGNHEGLYGGYYTQEEIRDIVAYAKARFVTVLPEIEMPGHSWAALIAYPELCCTETKPGPDGHHMQNVYCAGKEKTFEFLEGILDEVLELFPSRLIHIGGDEVDKKFWLGCGDCRRRMKEEGLENAEELQSWFIKRIEKYLNARGRQIIGWDEILQGGLAPGAAVMSWRGIQGGITAARAHHHVVMAPYHPLYFDALQGDPRYEPRTIGYAPNTLDMVYAFEPVPDALGPEEAAYILGAQGQAWTEWMFDEARVEYMVYPRACALAEVVWTQKERRDWDDFQARMQAHYRRLDREQVGYRIPPPTGLAPRTLFVDEAEVVLKKPVRDMAVYYTLDGSEPTRDSTPYEEPFTVDRTVTVKVRGFLPSGRATRVIEGTLEKAVFREPAQAAPAGLRPGLRCAWFEGDFDSVEKLAGAKPVKETVEARLALPKGVPADRFGLVFEGFLRVPEDGIYTFRTASDDGSRLYIGDDLVVENDGFHGKVSRTGSAALRAGLHPLRVLFFEAGGAEALEVTWRGPGIPEGPLPAEALFHEE